jgi:hypothetical protein
MADISEEDRELRNMKFTMINQHEEENETNQSGHTHMAPEDQRKVPCLPQHNPL